jgi:hypothetical protein
MTEDTPPARSSIDVAAAGKILGSWQTWHFMADVVLS